MKRIISMIALAACSASTEEDSGSCTAFNAEGNGGTVTHSGSSVHVDMLWRGEATSYDCSVEKGQPPGCPVAFPEPFTLSGLASLSEEGAALVLDYGEYGTIPIGPCER